MIREVKGLAPIHNRALIFADCEFLGFGKRQPIVEFAAIKRKPDGTTDTLDIKIAVTDYEIANAEPKALEVIGFTREEWTNAMPKTDAFALVHDFVAAHTLVGFNIVGDIRRLEGEFDCSEIPTVRHWVGHIELAELLRARHPDWPAYNLATACERYGLPPEGHHRALGGATRAMQVFDRFIQGGA